MLINKKQKKEFNQPGDANNSESISINHIYMTPRTALTYILYETEFFWEMVTKQKRVLAREYYDCYYLT